MLNEEKKALLETQLSDQIDEILSNFPDDAVFNDLPYLGDVSRLMAHAAMCILIAIDENQEYLRQNQEYLIQEGLL
jgi:hypothetical protein